MIGWNGYRVISGCLEAVVDIFAVLALVGFLAERSVVRHKGGVISSGAMVVGDTVAADRNVASLTHAE